MIGKINTAQGEVLMALARATRRMAGAAIREVMAEQNALFPGHPLCLNYVYDCLRGLQKLGLVEGTPGRARSWHPTGEAAKIVRRLARERRMARQQTITEHADLERDIKTAARILKEAGATEVYVFGSAARGEASPDSDIDLAIRGIPPEYYFRAMSKVTLALTRPIDLIDLDAPSPFAEFLIRKGRLQRVG